MLVTDADTPKVARCPGCGRLVPNPGMMANALDAERREWHWKCAEATLAQVPSVRSAPAPAVSLDGTPMHLPGCPGCGEQPYSIDDDCRDSAERLWHWGVRGRRWRGTGACRTARPRATPLEGARAIQLRVAHAHGLHTRGDTAGAWRNRTFLSGYYTGYCHFGGYRTSKTRLSVLP